MPDNFQQTVNLRERLEKRASLAAEPKRASQSEPLETIYAGEDYKKISRPAAPVRSGLTGRLALAALALIVAAAAVYVLFFKGGGQPARDKNWYAARLIDSTVYYGQILNLKADPVEIINVYYDYNQAKAAEKTELKAPAETGNLLLVKRGKETAGGDGTIRLYQANILMLEPLKADSKVLKAILEYEK